VPHGEPPGHDITGREETVRQAQRLEYERGNIAGQDVVPLAGVDKVPTEARGVVERLSTR
jgi:hypothetical protein